jgi:hypothetical protein
MPSLLFRILCLEIFAATEELVNWYAIGFTGGAFPMLNAQLFIFLMLFLYDFLLHSILSEYLC